VPIDPNERRMNGSNSAASHSWGKGHFTSQALAHCALDPIPASAVGIESRRTIRANHPKILQPMAVANAIDVIQNHRHWPAAPHLALTAKLTLRLLMALCQKTMLEVVAGIGRSLDEDLGERLPPLLQVVLTRRGRIEMIGRYLPDRGVFLEDPPGATCGAKAERSQALSP
jgi:hypothetical protein